MAWTMTEARYDRINNRLTRIEEVLNDIIVGMESYVTTSQVQSLLAILTAQIGEISSTVDTLEDRVEDIEAEPIA